MMWSVFGFGTFLFLFALSPWYGAGIVLVFIANVFASLYGTLNNTAIQVLIPDKVRGRVSSSAPQTSMPTSCARGPLKRTMPIPPCPGGVAIAAIRSRSSADT